MRPRPLALLLAVGLDLVAGEWSDRFHPVARIGRALARAEARARGRTVVDGATALAAVTMLTWAVAALVARLARLAGSAGLGLEALALKPAFAIRRLNRAAGEIEALLRADDLDGARRAVGRHLVSRRTESLDRAEVTSATVESVAENLTDSVVAPLGAYALGGLPLAWVYRALNTADAMWGYRDPRYERFGKAAARLDDAANLVPARLAAAAVAAGAAAAGEDAAGAARVAWRDHRRTSSPNAGWPMAAMAGALDVGLAKAGVYRLGAASLPVSSDAIRRARRVFAAAAGVAVAGALALALCRRSRAALRTLAGPT